MGISIKKYKIHIKNSLDMLYLREENRESEEETMDFMLIFDLVIAGLGLYLIYSSLKMKQTGELSTIVVNQDDMARCKNKQGFIEAIAMKSVYFGIIALIFGILAILNDFYSLLGKYFNVVGAVVFIGAWMWFAGELRKAREKFFY